MKNKLKLVFTKSWDPELQFDEQKPQDGAHHEHSDCEEVAETWSTDDRADRQQDGGEDEEDGADERRLRDTITKIMKNTNVKQYTNMYE